MGFWEEYGIWVDFGFNRSGSGSIVSSESPSDDRIRI